ncbi:unnamed protein product [Closterium sp. NIES-53]
MEFARTSMIHAAAPHFMWSFAVRYTAHQLNLWPRVSLPETSPTLRWMGKVGDASVFRVWGSRAFVCDTSTNKLSSYAIPCDVTFDKSVPFYRLFPYRTPPPPHLPLFLAPGPPPVDPLPSHGRAPSGVSHVDPLPLAVPVEDALDSGVARGAASRGTLSGGAEPAIAEPGGAEPEDAEPGGAESEGPGGAEFEGAESGGAQPRGTASAGGPAGASPRLSHRQEPLSPQQLREWFAQRTRIRSGAAGAGGSAARGTSVGGAGVGGTGIGDPRVGGAGAGDARAGGPGAEGTLQRCPFFVPLQPSSLPPPDLVLRQVLSLSSSTGLTPSLLCPPPHQSQPQLQPDSPLPALSPYAERTDSLRERREPESRPASPVRAVRTGLPLPSPPTSSLPDVLDPDSYLARAATPTVPRLLASVVTDPSFESTAASALVAELVEFAVACRINYATRLVAESEPDCPPSVGGESALSTDVLEDRQEDFECLATDVPHLVAMLLPPEGDLDAPDIPTLRSYAEATTGTYVNVVPPSGENIVDGMWIFRVKRPPGSPTVFKARYVARGFSQRQGVDFFQTFSPTLKMTTLRVLLHVAAQHDYELHSFDFSTDFLHGSLHEEIWLRRPPGFTGSFPAGTQWSLRRPVHGLRQAPREWHDTLRTLRCRRHFAAAVLRPRIIQDRARRTITLTQSHMVQQVLQRFGFRYSSPQSTSLPTGHSL